MKDALFLLSILLLFESPIFCWTDAHRTEIPCDNEQQIEQEEGLDEEQHEWIFDDEDDQEYIWEDTSCVCLPFEEDFFPLARSALFPFFTDLIWRVGDGRSYKEGYESIEAFLAIYEPCKQSYPFVDIRVNRVENGRLALNCGLGWRLFSPNLEEMFGANVYYDQRHFSGSDFRQIGVGIELLGKCWDIRGNGYLPIGNKKIWLDTTVFSYSDVFFATRRHYKSAMWGIDVEIGRNLFCKKCVTIYAAVGPYFYGSKCCNSMVGGMARVAAFFSNNLTFQLFITHDRLFDTKVQGEIRLTIPFSCLTRNWRCFFTPVERNPIILTEDLCFWDTNF